MRYTIIIIWNGKVSGVNMNLLRSISTLFSFYSRKSNYVCLKFPLKEWYKTFNPPCFDTSLVKDSKYNFRKNILKLIRVDCMKILLTPNALKIGNIQNHPNFPVFQVKVCVRYSLSNFYFVTK